MGLSRGFGSGGRIQALEFLNSRPLKFPWIGWTYEIDEIYYWNNKKCKKFKGLIGLRWEPESLANLSVNNGAHLSRIRLCSAILTSADLSDAHLNSSNLREANLKSADLTPEQVKSACYWEEANFDLDFTKRLEEEPNQEVDCSEWENNE